MAFDPTTCTCEPVPVGTTCGSSSGTDCDNADTCDGAGHCQANHEPAGTACTSDPNPCTDDVCDGSGACTHPNNTSPCNDNNACTTNDICGGGVCVGGSAPNCDDNNPCTDDSCNPVTGCANTPNGSCCTPTLTDDFNRADLGPNWQTCANVSIVNNALQFFNTSGTPTNCPNPGDNFAYAKLVVPGSQVRDGAVQFDLDNGGPTRANNAFRIGFGSFYVHINQDTYNDTTCRRRVELYGPGGQLAQLCDVIINTGRYEFSVSSSSIRFRNISGGTAVNLQATDTTVTGPGSLEIRVNEDTTRVDNLVLTNSSCPRTAFCDTFNRPDSDTVGNGWSEIELAPGDARIAGGRLNLPNPADGAVVWRPHGGGAGGSNITVSFTYRKTIATPEVDDVSVRHNGVYRGDNGLFLAISVGLGQISVVDGNAGDRGSATYDFSLNTDYSFQWDIYTDNSMNVWIWPAGGVRPASPQLLVPTFTPVSQSTNWAFVGRIGAYFDDFCVETPARPRTVGVIGGPITNPTNGHTYYLLDYATWADSEAAAVRLGGHLATINDQAEQDWVLSTFGSFGGVSRTLWIGLRSTTTPVSASAYSWVSGDPATYRHWGSGEPSDFPDELYTYIYCPDACCGVAGYWNNIINSGGSAAPGSGGGCIVYGVVEVP